LNPLDGLVSWLVAHWLTVKPLDALTRFSEHKVVLNFVINQILDVENVLAINCDQEVFGKL